MRRLGSSYQRATNRGARTCGEGRHRTANGRPTRRRQPPAPAPTRVEVARPPRTPGGGPSCRRSTPPPTPRTRTMRRTLARRRWLLPRSSEAMPLRRLRALPESEAHHERRVDVSHLRRGEHRYRRRVQALFCHGSELIAKDGPLFGERLTRWQGDGPRVRPLRRLGCQGDDRDDRGSPICGIAGNDDRGTSTSLLRPFRGAEIHPEDVAPSVRGADTYGPGYIPAVTRSRLPCRPRRERDPRRPTPDSRVPALRPHR